MGHELATRIHHCLNGIAISWSGPPSLPGLIHLLRVQGSLPSSSNVLYTYVLTTCPNLLKTTFSGYLFPSRNTKKPSFKGNAWLLDYPPGFRLSVFFFAPRKKIFFSSRYRYFGTFFSPPRASFLIRSFFRDSYYSP